MADDNPFRGAADLSTEQTAAPVAGGANGAVSDAPAGENPFRGTTDFSSEPQPKAIEPAPAQPVETPPVTEPAKLDDISRPEGMPAEPAPAPKPVEPPKAPDENRNGNIVDNGIKDVNDLTQGGVAMASAAAKRLRDIGTTTWDQMHQLGSSQLSDKLLHTGISDGKFAIDTLSGAAQDYYHRYIDPLVSGDPGRFAQQLQHHPFNSMLDLAPVPKAAGALAKMGDEALTQGVKAYALHSTTEEGARMAGREAVTQAVDKLEAAKSALKPDFAALPFIKEPLERAQVFNEVRDALRGANFHYQDYLKKTNGELNRAYADVPNFIKPFIIEAGEGTNRVAMDMVRGSVVSENFMKLAQKHTDRITNELIRHGFMTQEDAMRARYGPAYMAFRHRVGKPINAGQLKDPEHMAGMSRLQDKLNTLGIKPHYFGIMQATEAAKYLEREVGVPLNQIKKESTGFLEARDKAVIQHPPNAPARTKLRNTSHEQDARNAAAVRIFQGARLLHIMKALQKISNNSLLSTNQKGWVKVDMAHVMGRAAEASGLDKSAITQFLANVQKEIVLPVEAAQHIHQFLTDFRTPAVYNWAATTFKYCLLGPDIFWGAIQFAQNGVMAATTVRRPQEIGNAFLSMVLTTSDKAARELVPGHLVEGHQAIGTGAAKAINNELLSSGEKWAHVAKQIITLSWADKLLQANFGIAREGNNYWRITAANAFMMRELELSGANPKIIQRMLEGSAGIEKLKEDLKAGYRNEALEKKVTQDVFDVLGHYEKERGLAGKALVASLPFWPWMEHAWTYSKWSYHETPVKTAMLASITKVAGDALQKGDIPDYWKRMGGVPAGRDADGHPLVMVNGSLTPFMQTPENIRQVLGTIAPFFGNEGEHQEAGVESLALNPWLKIGLWFAANVKEGGREYEDPRLFPYGNGHVSRDTMKQVMETGIAPDHTKIQQHVKPNIIDALGQTFIPREWTLAARIFESPKGVPSDMTSFVTNQHAPKKLSGGKNQTPLPLTEYLIDFGKFAPKQTKFNTEDEQSIEASMMKKAIKGYAMRTRDEEPAPGE